MFTTLLLVALSVLATAAYFLLTQRRRVPNLDVNINGLPPVADGLQLLAGLTSGSVFEGNRLTVYQNGAMFDAMLARISEAKYTIHLETFVWSTGKLESKFVELLSQRARDGLEVRMLLVAVGSIEGSDQAFTALRDAGVKLHFYCRPRWWNLRRFNHRTHRKLLIIDGTVAYTGGHGISDLWTGDAQDESHYRDVDGAWSHVGSTNFDARALAGETTTI